MSDNNSQMKQVASKIINSNWFNFSIMGFIILNGVLIGVQTYDGVPNYIRYIQLFILFIFFVEVILRWIGRNSTEEYISDWWNWFDIFILLIGVVPEVYEIIAAPSVDDKQNSVLATLRVLRIVQLTRSIRAIDELRVLIGVLLKSIKSLSYIAILFLLIMYIYAVVGVTLFKNPEYAKSEHLELTISNPDPYGDIGEAFFTLFRILTGEDWTDLRYNLLDNEFTQNNKDGKGRTTIPESSNTIVTFYHVSWMVIAAYLLMNLVVGAIVNNFQLVLDAKKAEEEKANQNGDGGDDDDDGGTRRRIIKKPNNV
ncbi:MAG: ion transporter [Saprospiraceae bacterium]|nr:ion transporter [Saprospiraceae bacterium]